MVIRRVLTGMRTTGRLHLGHYVGALEPWLKYQNDTEFDYDCYFLLADFQALSTHASRPEVLTRSIREVVQDWLSVGLDPTRPNVHFVQQSQIPERYELSMLLQMVARFKDVMDIPTINEEMKNLEDPPTVGFVTYPVDQAADVFMVTPQPPGQYDRIYVPVGDDQNPILERNNLWARTFNQMYGRRVFVQCTIHGGRLGRLPGTGDPDMPEGGKMSKSRGNTIDLADGVKAVHDKVMAMYTDKNHLRVTDPGETTKNPVFVYLRTFHDDGDRVAQMEEDYRTPGVRLGDVEVKNELSSAINRFLEPIRDRRARFKEADLREYVMEGTRLAREHCVAVTNAARDAMHLAFPS